MLASSAKATARALRSAEQQVVQGELHTFEATHLRTAAAPTRPRTTSRSNLSDSSETCFSSSTPAAVPAAAASSQANTKATPVASRSARTAQAQRLMQVPFTGSAVHGERTALGEAQQVHAAAAWLRECPSSTLRQLQQRVLCATETLFTRLVGMPAAARELLALSADPNERKEKSDHDGDDAAEQAADAYVTPPAPLTFTEFISTFLRDTSATSSHAAFYGVLLSGRPQPVAPLSSLHLVYGLHVVEDVLRPPPSTSDATAAATTTASGLEANQALLSEVVHWAHFFESIFDKAREGLCRDPMNFYAAVLLACAERGAWELRSTPEAVAEEAVRRLSLDDDASGRRPHTCSACQTEATQLAERCRTYVRHTLRTMQQQQQQQRQRDNEDSEARTSKSTASGKARSQGGSRRRGAEQTRFFLATPAVVWWAAAFLRLYRLRTPVAAPTLTAATAANEAPAFSSSAPPAAESSTTHDVVSSAEMYFLRDWIARAAKMDEDGFVAQEEAGAFVIPLSCATATSVAVFRFTPENVRAALQHVSEWADAAVTTGAPLHVQELLSVLQDDFPVVPYYMGFFSPN